MSDQENGADKREEKPELEAGAAEVRKAAN